MIRVLFVCLGNICRSPMAEALFKDYANKKGLSDQFYFESRATSGWEQGNPVHPKTLQVLAEHQIKFEGKTSKRITERDFLEYDYIIGMDKKNLIFLKNFEDGHYANKVHLLVPRKGVPDPYITGDFNQTYRMITNIMDKWFKRWLGAKESH